MPYENLRLLVPFAVAILSLLATVTYFIVKVRGPSLLFSCILYQSMPLIWVIGYSLELSASNMPEKWMALRFTYVGLCYLGTGVLLFAMNYVASPLLRKRYVIPLLLVIPSLNYAMLFTDQYLHLFYVYIDMAKRAYGFGYWFHSITTYIYIFTGLGALVKFSLEKYRRIERSILLVILSWVLPMAVNTLNELRIPFITNNLVEIRLYTSAFSVLLFAIATFQYRFRNIIPVALEEIVEDMKESVVVLDSFRQVITANQAFKRNILTDLPPKADSGELLAELKEEFQMSAEAEGFFGAILDERRAPISAELQMLGEPAKFFQVNIQPVYGRHQERLGLVITFNDVTEYKRMVEEVNAKNQALALLNLQTEELAAVRERNRIARDVHDILGHSITMIITILEASRITCRQNPRETEAKLAEAVDMAREGLRELRRSLDGLTPGKLEAGDLVKTLEELVAEFRATGLKIRFTAGGQARRIEPNCAGVIYRICEEGLTNALRHGKAKNATVVLRFLEDRLRLLIADDGIGCQELKKGYGLTGMEARVYELGGRIVYGSSGDFGFSIFAELPLEGAMVERAAVHYDPSPA